MVRYADDFVALCHSEEEARQALGRIQDFAKANGLRLHPEKPGSWMRASQEDSTSLAITLSEA